MSSVGPNLPPRKVESPNGDFQESEALKTSSYLSPLALLVCLETNQKEHKHVFKSLIVDSPPKESQNEEEKLIETVNTDDFTTTPTNETVTVAHFICQACHAWLHVTHTSIEKDESVKVQNKCPGNDYICHHYHTQGLDAYQCCGCEYTLATEMQDPVLPMTLFKRLEATRPKARSFVDLMQQKEQLPTMVSTLTTVLIYIKDLLSGTKRNINVNNPHFLARIGLSDGSQSLLETIGFQLNDNYFIAPDIERGTSLDARLKRIQHEIILTVDALRQELGSTTVPTSTAEADIKVKTADMQRLFGIVPTLENRYTSSSDYLSKAYTTLGLTSGASDKLASWTYTKLMNESTSTMDPYDALDSLLVIANQTNSEVLQTLIACERSKGKIARTDIGDAYAYFGVDQDSADDRLLIGLYQVKLSDEPLQKSVHQDKLKTIAIARHSSELIEFLKEEKGIPASTNVQSVEDMMGVPAHMINIAQQTPVGLNNIGNTCYFNSLLQYYFTFIPFRDTMINNEAFVEDENCETKTIGGIRVDQAEIRRAKRFVELLKTLFVNLQETDEKAISPAIDLAYMALLNEKEEEAIQDTSSSKEEKETTETTETADTTDTTSAMEEVEEDKKTSVDTVMEDAPSSEANSINQADKSRRSSDIEYEFAHANFTSNVIPPPSSPPPSYEDIAPEAANSTFETEIKKDIERPKFKERPSVDNMMFGRQQDVTECMGNVMYLVEAALKPLRKTEEGEQIDDMIRQLFYGKSEQILSYVDDTTMQTVKKTKEEDFSHVIVDASEGKDLYDGLDEYFFADRVENFRGGQEATREVSVKSLPPVLQVIIQRVQFDRTTANVYKSNAYIQFDKVIYLDRYLDENFSELKDKRLEVAGWRAELDKNKRIVSKYSKSTNLKVPIPDVLDATYRILADFQYDSPEEDKERFTLALRVLEEEANSTRQLIQSSIDNITQLKQKITDQYKDYTQIAYKLHAVFIHQGQANYGHYWIYILDHNENQWWKYNDSLVTKANESEIFHDTTGSTANPYFLVYVDASKLDQVVETIVKRPDITPPVA